MNKKGVSLIALAITIIVIIIIAAIAISSSLSDVNHTNKAAFMSDLENAVNSLRIYNQRAVGFADPSIYYDEIELQWDGSSEYCEHTAKLQDGTNEDTPEYIFNNTLTSRLKDKIYIKNGALYIKKEFPTEFEWATESYYKYMLSGDNI